ncbi:MAG: ISL3 family transposase [Acidimicrobiales bacterium]
MRNVIVWVRALGLSQTVVEQADFDDGAGAVVVSVRPKRGARQRCGRCKKRSPWYDRGEGRRRLRALDVGELACYVEAVAPRVNCAEHGPTVAAVPWARHGAGHTLAFDDQVAWLATHTSKTAVTELMRVAWRTVGAIINRVIADGRAARDPLDGLRRIGIDEISYRRGYKFLTVVVDHDSGRLVWAGVGKERKTLEAFFDLLGPERCALIAHVSADGAEYIAGAVAERCPKAVQCADPYHVSWATRALDDVRREAWNELRRQGGDPVGAKALQRSRFSLWKNPENLTARQKSKLAWVAKNNERLYRAYLMKEQLRVVFQLPTSQAKGLLSYWLCWAQRCRIPQFVELARKVKNHLAEIHATLDHGLSNALVESTNTKLRLLTRMAFGFASPEALIALALLDRGGYCPDLPGRSG